jgi:hypothetical protein
MRISTLLLFLSALFLTSVTPVGAQTPDDSLQSAPSLKFDRANADGSALDHYRWDGNLARFRIDNVRSAQDQICYTIRSYKVERTERMDDSTEPMKYSVCQPSSGFEVKNADESVILPEGPQP